MKRCNIHCLILIGAIIAIGATGNSQTIKCDGLAEGGTGNFGNAVTNCPPFTTTYDYIYEITDPTPEAPESVYIGTHDGILSHYKDICLPAGWTFNIISASPDHNLPFKVDGFIVSPSPQCSFFMEFIGPMSAGTEYIGFNHKSVPHQVSWEIGTLGPNVSVAWTDLIGSGTGPVHGPYACDSLGTIYFADGDCNVDGNVLTVSDAVYLAQILQGSILPSSHPYHCDLNGDCIIDSSDLILFQNFFTSGISVFDPYGGYPVPTCCSIEVVTYPEPGNDSCVEFTVECCDGKPTVARGLVPLDFSGQIAVATCYADPANPLDEPYVVGIVDLTKQCSAPLGTPALDPNGFEPPMYHNEYPGNPTSNPDDEWHLDNLGSVFGLALDNLGNIYVTATSCYSNDIFPTVHGPGTGGEIYKLDKATGAITLFASGPLPNSGQGLGNISYDCLHDQMFVSNMDDGIITGFINVAGGGTAIFPYDHGVDGRNAAGLIPPIPDDPSQGFTQLGRRIWGLEVVNGTDFFGQPYYRLYYAVWWEDQCSPNTPESNEIWSVGLDPTNGGFLPATARLEITLPPFQANNHSSPVSDITFKPDGRIILAERSMCEPSTTGAHVSRLLEYACDSGLWVRQLAGTPPDDIFQLPLSTVGGNPSCAGGVDFDYRTDYTSPCVGRVWATADGSRFPSPSIYGLVGFPPAGGNSGNNTDCILIDLDAEFTQQDKTELGDVEVPCRCCNGNLGDANGDGIDANILDLTFMVDFIFRGGQKSSCAEESDINSDGAYLNILDLTFMVDFIFRGGPAPGPC